MRQEKKPREIRPSHMALCKRCAAEIGKTYGERLHEYERQREGVCGYCAKPATVHSCDLYPKIRRAYSPRAGGGERRRAGR